MRRSLTALILSLLVVGLLLTPARAVVGGEPDFAHPYVGTLIAEWPELGALPVCSGTLIAPTVFVTAAHCVVEESIGDLPLLGISFAQDPTADPDLAANLIGIADIIVHPDFVYYDPFTDVAVILLATAVTDLGYATLPELGQLETLQTRRNARDATFTVVGYGASDRIPVPGGRPQPFYDDTRRVATARFVEFVYPVAPPPRGDATVSSLLALTTPGIGGSICYGDSGGPNFLGGMDSNLLVGITVTRGNPSGECTGTYHVLRLDTEPILSFLAQFV
jgi:secreted trypsin-like serine protease